MPTQVVSRSQANLPSASTNIPGWLYAVLGAMAAIIVALGVAFFVTYTPTEKETAKADLNSNQTNNENKSQNIQNTQPNIPQTAISTKQIESPPITTEAVRGLLIRWEKAQDTQSYRAYQACYGQPF